VRRRRAESALRASYEQNQDLTGRLITAQEEERARIARDLHDDVGQQLAGLSIMLGALKRRLGATAKPHDIEETLIAAQKRTSALAADLRNLSHELHPAALEHIGLVAALKGHCEDITRHHKVDVAFTAGDDCDALSPEIRLCLYRVTQAALANVVRHAQAHHAEVRLSRMPDRIELDITDDGVGFASDRPPRGGLGVRSIDERARLLKGSATFDSGPGRGTRVLVRIPLRT